MTDAHVTGSYISRRRSKSTRSRSNINWYEQVRNSVEKACSHPTLSYSVLFGANQKEKRMEFVGELHTDNY